MSVSKTYFVLPSDRHWPSSVGRDDDDSAGASAVWDRVEADTQRLEDYFCDEQARGSDEPVVALTTAIYGNYHSFQLT